MPAHWSSTHPFAAVKIYISSDMEGTAGVVDWDHVRSGTRDYEYYVELLTNEINAAIEGAIEAGADEFVVNDSHGRMANLRPGALAGKASYLSGRFKPRYMMEGLDDSFDGVFLISYHGSMSSSSSVLSHTYFPQAFADVTLNGHVAGESGVNALVAKAYGVPIVLITGDATTAAEIKDFCPGIRSALVKRSITRFAAESLHPDEANRCIREEARSFDRRPVVRTTSRYQPAGHARDPLPQHGSCSAGFSCQGSDANLRPDGRDRRGRPPRAVHDLHNSRAALPGPHRMIN